MTKRTFLIGALGLGADLIMETQGMGIISKLFNYVSKSPLEKLFFQARKVQKTIFR